MKERTVEVKTIKRQYCYKEKKFKTPEGQKCPYGYEEYQDSCINCRWYAEDILSREDTRKLENINQKIIDFLEILKKTE